MQYTHLSEAYCSLSSLILQLINEVKVKQPDVECVLEKADQLYRDSPLEQPGKVRKLNAGESRGMKSLKH